MLDSLDEGTLEAIRATTRELSSQDGRGVSRETILELARHESYALSIVAGEPPVVLARPRATVDFTRLTPREREVAALVARGMRNAEIAAALFISTATVKDHVHRILRKTGLDTRAAVAAAWANTPRT
jgi:DNA-binding NarL/FixJ family response regulator